jgi:hypothetical protein
LLAKDYSRVALQLFKKYLYRIEMV